MTVDPKLWRAVFERDRGVCQYCGVDLLASFSSYWSATVDHVVAVSVGGGDSLENLVLSCPACNGMLCRSGSLISIEERRKFVAARRSAELQGYKEWIDAFRGRVV